MVRSNKKARQIEAKNKHREFLKAGRRAEPLYERFFSGFNEKPTVLIVCEGKLTEPSYFKHFRLSTAKIKAIGEGYNTVSLVERAAQLSEEGDYEQVWCVFDKDDFSSNDFNNAITKAEHYGFGVAYSNQAFEYWIILHLDDHQGGGMHRQFYGKRINTLLQPYALVYDSEGSKEITEDIFDVLEGIDPKTAKKRYLLAIERAERNYNRTNQNNPAAEESSTTVFRLVKELLKHI
jgi:hypothetical protein